MTQEKTVDTHPSVASDRQASQDGSILVSMAGALLLLVVLLGSIQMGYAFYVKRELQKAADLAALSGVQMFVDGTECEDAISHAQGIVDLNVANLGGVVSAPTCGIWEEDEGTGILEFKATAAAPHNALQVAVSENVVSLIPFINDGGLLQASATATGSEPVAAFSVGSRLLRSTLLGLLKVNALDANGLITTNDLLDGLGLLDEGLGLGVGTPQELLNLPSVKLGNLLTVTAELLSQGGTAEAEVLAVQEVVDLLLNLPGVNQIDVRLFGGEESDGGVFLLTETANASSALAAQVNALDLIATSAFLSNNENFLKLEPTEIELGILGVRASAHIVEPPAFVIGGVGAKGENAQVNLDVSVSLLQNVPLLNSLGLRIILELAQSKAELTELCANPDMPTEAKFEVNTSLVGLCFAPPGAVSGYECLESSGTLKFEVMNILGILPIKVPVGVNLLEILSSQEDVALQAPPFDPSTQTVKAVGLNTAILADVIVAALLGSMDLPNVGAGHRNLLAAGLLEGSTLNLALQKVKEDSGFVAGVLDKPVVKSLLPEKLTKALGIIVDAVAGLVVGVGKLVGGLLDFILGLLLCHSDVCKLQYALFNDNPAAGVASLVSGLLKILVTPLGGVLEELFDTLGLSLAETDLTLHSVQCGTPRLVE